MLEHFLVLFSKLFVLFCGVLSKFQLVTTQSFPNQGELLIGARFSELVHFFLDLELGVKTVL